MRTLEASGKSIDEAIFKGLKELEISIDEVDIEIIQQETKGVLGIGAKPAIVRLIEREPEAIIVPEYLTEEAKKRREERAKAPRERRERRDRRANDRRGRESRAERFEERRDAEDEGLERGERINSRGEHVIDDRPFRAERPRREGAERRERPERHEKAPAAPKPEIPYSEELAKTEPAAVFLKGLLAKMGVEAQVLAAVEEAGEDKNAHVRLYIKAAHMGALIGHRGENLDAMQYITSLYINRNRREKGYTRVTIDTEGYRGKREETLVRLARKVASQVRATGRPRVLEPMNPYERRVLHSTLQPNPYVVTHSEGEEPYRRVVVEPKR